MIPTIQQDFSKKLSMTMTKKKLLIRPFLQQHLHDEPTSSPVTSEPTSSPSFNPTNNPTKSSSVHRNHLPQVPLIVRLFHQLNLHLPHHHCRLLSAIIVSGQEARQRLLVANIPLVKHTVKKVHQTRTASSFSTEDLVQEVTIGLAKAIDKFDYTLGHCFSTYAVYWIKASITRFV